MNNTTAETCLNALNETIDCIPLESSSLFDDIEILLLAGAALLGIAAWAYKKYQVLNADGKITLDEIIDSIDEVKEKAEEAMHQPSSTPSHRPEGGTLCQAQSTGPGPQKGIRRRREPIPASKRPLRPHNGGKSHDHGCHRQSVAEDPRKGEHLQSRIP